MATVADPQLITQVRLLTTDLDPDKPLLSDEWLQDFLNLNGKSVYRAAADALDTIATSQTLVSQKIKTQDLTTDGPAVAAALRVQADRLRARADDDEDLGAWDGFDLAAVVRGRRRPELTEPEVWGL